IAAAQRLEHLRRELAALHERVEDRLFEGLERAVVLVGGVPTVIGLVVAVVGEPRLQQKIGELVEQRLKIDGVGELGIVFAVGMKAHSSLPQEEYDRGGEVATVPYGFCIISIRHPNSSTSFSLHPTFVKTTRPAGSRNQVVGYAGM